MGRAEGMPVAYSDQTIRVWNDILQGGPGKLHAFAFIPSSSVAYY